ncbi:MAG: fructosamine kinase family protein [Bacteroidota bacterium]
MNANKHVVTRIQTLLNTNVLSLTPLSGGSIASAYRAELTDGSSVFIKTTPQHPDMFRKEANGLNELRRANAIRIPEVLTATDEILILEYLPVKTPDRRNRFFELLGRQLAGLHRTRSDKFGFTEDNYIGSTVQKNLPYISSWKEFFLVNRMEFQFHLAESNGYCDAELRTLFKRMESQIDTLIADDGEPPATLHGDLWSGNFLCLENDTPALIDPAVYYGHREMDLAMTMLFGGFDGTFYASYDDTYPLKDDWKRRCELYKLYHLFNHLNLFGESYYPQLTSVMNGLLR